MSIESFSPLPLNTFCGLITLLDPSDVPVGMSPGLSNVDFFPGGIRTRPGLVSIFSGVSGTPEINGLKTYITPSLVKRCLVYDATGNLYKEITPGVLAEINGGTANPGLYLASTTLFGREYMAFANGVSGQDIPRQYDDCAVIEQESAWDTFAIRFKPAFLANLGQVAREHGFNGRSLAELCRAESGLEVGCTVLARKIAVADGDCAKALALWNGGANQGYAGDVLRRMGHYSAPI